MLRFNPPKIEFEGISLKISIHPMLRFNEKNNLLESGIYEFQYILCYGSTLCKLVILRYNFISIHPMLQFNESIDNNLVSIREFQYILCYGSTSMLSGAYFNSCYFNTSYVTVQQVFQP